MALAGCCVSFAAGALPGEEPKSAVEFGGPIEMQDVYLPAQLRPQSYAESARVLRRGSFAVRTVADWTNSLAQTDRYLFDGESVVNTWRLRYAPLDRLEIGVDLPWTARTDGSLDSFIRQVERSLDAEVAVRFQRPSSEFAAIAINGDGRRVLHMHETDGLNDVSFRAKFAITRQEESGFDAALVASLAVPTGAETFGGEGVSPSLGVHAQVPVIETVNLFGGASMTYFTDATEQAFPLAPWRWMGYGGFEWRPCGSWFGLLGELQAYGPIARVDPPLTQNSYYWAGGMRVYLPQRVTLEAAVVENWIDNRNSSDVTFHFGVGWQFGN